ncbi:acyl carrier protein [Lactiplantibacillus plantarum]
MNNVYKYLKKELQTIGISENDIREDSKLKDDFELDSTELVDLTLSLKKEFGLEIDLSKPNDLTVGQLAKKINEKLERKNE